MAPPPTSPLRPPHLGYNQIRPVTCYPVTSDPPPGLLGRPQPPPPGPAGQGAAAPRFSLAGLPCAAPVPSRLALLRLSPAPSPSRWCPGPPSGTRAPRDGAEAAWGLFAPLRPPKFKGRGAAGGHPDPPGWLPCSRRGGLGAAGESAALLRPIRSASGHSDRLRPFPPSANDPSPPLLPLRAGELAAHPLGSTGAVTLSAAGTQSPPAGRPGEGAAGRAPSVHPTCPRPLLRCPHRRHPAPAPGPALRTRRPPPACTLPRHLPTARPLTGWVGESPF